MGNPIKVSDFIQDNGEIEKLINKLTKLEQTTENTLRSIIKEAKQLKTALDGVAAPTRKSADALAKLSKRANRLGNRYLKVSKTLRNVKSEIAELRKTQDQLKGSNEKLTKSIKRLQSSTKKYGDTSKKTFGVVKRFFEFFVLSKVVVGVQTLATRFLDVTKQLDSMRLSYSLILKTQQNVSDSMEFISDITERYGLELLATQKAYLKFRAAADASNVSVKETNQIFDSVSKSIAALGLNTNDANLIFLALEQIMAKGKVSSEELRRQLGERMPVAFGAMAKAAGVSTGELNDLLKAGDLASDEILPKFAVELEKALGVENENRIDNLSSAQNRFNNEVTRLIDALKAGNSLTQFFNTMSEGVAYIRENIKEIGRIIKSIGLAVIAYATLTTGLAKFAVAMKVARVAAAAANVQMGLHVVAVSNAKRAWRAFSAVLARNPIGLVAFAIAGLISYLVIFRENLTASERAMRDYNDALDDNIKLLQEEKEEVSALFDVAEDENLSKNQRIAALDELKRRYPNYLSNLDSEKTSLEDIKKVRKELNEQLDEAVTFQTLGSRLGAIDAELEAARERLRLAKETKKSSNAQVLANQQRKITGYEGAVNEILEKRRTIIQQILALQSEADQKDKNFVFDDEGKTSDRTKIDPDDAFKNMVAKLKLEAEAIKDARKKELRLEEIANMERERKAKELGVNLEVIEEIHRMNIAAINDKYDQKEKKGRVKKLQEELKERYAHEQRKIDLMSEGREKALAQSELDFYKNLLANDYKDISTFMELWQKEKNEIIKEYNEKDKKDIKKAYDEQLEILEKKHDTEYNMAVAQGMTEEQLRDLKLQQEIDYAQAKLDIAASTGMSLTEIEKKQFEAQLAAARARLAQFRAETSSGEENESFWSMLGFDFSKEEQRELEDALQTAKEAVEDYYKTRIKYSKEALQQADRELDQAQERLQAELELKNQGYAADVEGARREVELAKQVQKEKVNELRKAQREQLVVQSVEQAANLITAASKIFSQLGIFGAPAVAVMFAAFASAKKKAFEATKAIRKEGGFDVIKGGTHKSGKDTYLGYSDPNSNNPVYGERDEIHMVFKKKAAKKYGKERLRSLWRDINTGKLPTNYLDQKKEIARRAMYDYTPEVIDSKVNDFSLMNFIDDTKIDTTKMEQYLSSIAKNSERSYTMVNNKVIEKYKNVTNIYESV